MLSDPAISHLGIYFRDGLIQVQASLSQTHPLEPCVMVQGQKQPQCPSTITPHLRDGMVHRGRTDDPGGEGMTKGRHLEGSWTME